MKKFPFVIVILRAECGQTFEKKTGDAADLGVAALAAGGKSGIHHDHGDMAMMTGLCEIRPEFSFNEHHGSGLETIQASARKSGDIQR